MAQGQPVDARRVAAALGGRSVVLVGMMGAGKTSVGKRLAAKLGLPFVDADAEIEAGAQLTIPEIFERFGEAYFRDGRAQGDRAPAERRAAGAGDRRRRLHERDDPREHRRARRVDLAEAGRRGAARARAQEIQPPASADRRSRGRPCAGSWTSARRPTRSPTSRSNRATGRTSRWSSRCCAASRDRCAAAPEPAGDRRRVEVPLGARAYSILIGPGLIDEAGRGDRADRAGGQMRDRHRRQCRAALSRPADGEPRRARASTSAVDRLPAGRGDQVLRRIRARLGRADRGAHRAARHRHRARRRRDRRPRRLLRRLVAPRRALRPDSRPRCWRRSIRASAARPAINSPHGKNLVGAFHQPSLVLADSGVSTR